MTKTVKEIVAEIKETLDKKGGLKHVYFVACGGSKAAIFPGLYLLQSEAKTFSATTYTSNEFVHATPKELDDRCVAVICSLKATAETVEAVKKANSIGAITIAMTGNMDMFCYFTRSASAPFGTAPTCFPVISPFLNAINVGMLITP